MDRRTFAKAGACLAASALSSARVVAREVSANGELSVSLFSLSVMLWTVFRDLPFEQRLEKVAQAGYRNVELVGEYEKWTDADFERANAKRKELGVTFDCTAGLKRGLCNPADRDALLGQQRAELAAEASAADEDKSVDPIREQVGELQGDAATERMPDERGRSDAEVVE